MTATEAGAPAHGNEQVIKLLENYLEKARLGKAAYGLVALAELPAEGDYDTAGSTDLEDVALAALDLIREKIVRARLRRALPDEDPSAPADQVCYNVAGGSVGYDFTIWLIDAEMTRRREGAPFPLKVSFFMGRDGDAEKTLSTFRYRQMFNSVMRPALKLIGAVEVPVQDHYRSKAFANWENIVKAVRAGETVPNWQASAQAMQQMWSRAGAVTITLREAKHSQHRNSNLAEWQRFARYLYDIGERVVFVRDTVKAVVPMDSDVPGGWEICPLASVNLDARCALYAQAKCNLFVSNGPFGIAQFGPVPWLMFCPLDEEDEFIPNRPSWFSEHSGIEPYTQLPWATANQRIVWEKDNFDNILRAWQQLRFTEGADARQTLVA